MEIILLKHSFDLNQYLATNYLMKDNISRLYFPQRGRWMKCCKISNKTRVQAIPWWKKKVSLKCLHFNHWKIDTFSSGTFQLLSSLPLVRLLSSTECNCLQIFSGQKYRESCDIFFFFKRNLPSNSLWSFFLSYLGLC